MNTERLFIDMGFAQCNRAGEMICGDAIAFKRLAAEERFIAVLSDGLGHGVKANILASLTTTMALRFVAADQEIVHSAEIIMDALPVCRERRISYATFTIVDTRLDGQTRVIEMGNPEFLLLRNGRREVIESQDLESPRHEGRTMQVYTFRVEPHDRLIFCSDGITQAGMGSRNFPLGWRLKGCENYALEEVARREDISAHELAQRILNEAIAKEEQHKAGDDITCAVIYFRTPRRLMLFTGPPFDRGRDHECAELLRDFKGAKIVAGGTTADIISREFGKPVVMDLSTVGGDLPPMSRLEGVDLVTEGIFTLTKAAQYLEKGPGRTPDNPAGRMVELLLSNDIIEIVVGTRINEAHQDPKLPLDLEIRRNIIKRVAQVLQDKYLKEVHIRFV